MKQQTIFCLIWLAIICKPAAAQFDDSLINLTTKGIDSFVLISPAYYYSPPKNLPGIGSTIIYNETYLFYKKNGIILSKKIVVHCNEDCSNAITSVSNLQEIRVDSVFGYLSENIKQLESDYFLPFVYRDFDPEKKTECFRTIRTSHPTMYGIRIKLGEHTFTKSHNLDDCLVSTARNTVQNLNATYNRQTKLFKLLELLLRSMESCDPKYTFDRKDD